MEQQVKTKVQFTDDYSSFTNLENNDSLSTGFGKIHYDLGYLKSEDQRQESEINAIAQAGSKNICPIGTETHSSEIGFGTEYSFLMPEGAYIISLTGTMVAPIQFNVYSESGTRIALVDIHTIEEAESGVRFVLNDNATKCKFWYDTSDNYILSNIMIRDASITDNTYQPYSPTNRQLYDLVNEKQDSLTFDGTYDSDLNPVATVSTVSNSINDLDVSSVGGSGKYISAIRETNGKISATAETMDTTPTSGSEKAVTSGAVYAALASKQAELSQSQLAAANSGITAAKLTADETALGEVINGGAAGTKNLLDCSLQSIKAVTQNSAYGFSWNGNVCTSTRGVSFTINADNSITVAATNTQNDVWFKLTDFMYSAGSYVISGCPTNGSTSSYYIESDMLNYRDLGNGVSFTINSTTTDSIYIIVKSGQTFEKTFYPMLCPKVLYDADPSYVPYAPALTNIILTPAAIKQVDGGAKNVAQTNDVTKNGNGFVNTDPISGDLFVSAATVSTTASSSTFAVVFYYTDGTISASKQLPVTNSLVYEFNTGEKVVKKARIFAGNTAEASSGKTITLTNFMICTAADWAVSQKFVRHAKTNRELTVENASQQSEIDYAVNTGVKNFLDVQRPTATTRTSYTPLANGGVELSCSNATWTSYAIADIPVEARKEYIITFLLDESSGTSNFSFFLRDGDSSGTNLATKNYGSTTGNYEASFTPINSAIWLGIYLNNSATAVTATAKLRCMIRPASITDSTFVPYAPSNRELYEMIQALQNNS